MTRFKKGQLVYKADTNISEVRKNGEVTVLCMVIEREIDSCGEKRMTFKDYGNDRVFDRQTPAYNERYFDSTEKAFDFLESVGIGCRNKDIAKNVFSDKNSDWVKYAEAWRQARN